MKHLAARLGFRLSVLTVLCLGSVVALLGVGATISRSFAESENTLTAQSTGREKHRAQIRAARPAARALESAHHSLGASLPTPPMPVVSITVDRTDDAPAASACTAAANDCSLRGAVIYANSAPGTTINLPAGTYQLTIAGGSEGFSGNTSIGDLDIAQSGTSIIGAGAATTIIQQTTASNDRVIEVNPNLDAGFTFSLSGVTIKGGRSSDGGGGIISGSFNNSTSVTNCIFDGNQSFNPSSPGGAIYNLGGGNLTVSGSTFTGNSSTHSAGGAIAMDNIDPGNLTVTASSFSNNTTGSASSGGGAISITGPGGAHNITNTSFQGNQVTSGSGGGGAIFSSNSGGTLNVRFSRFYNNSAATPINGRAIRRSGGGITASENWWGVNDGPIANDISGTVTVASWLQLRIIADPNSVCPDHTSNLTADIYGLSTGGTTAASNLSNLPPFAATFSTTPPNTVSPTATQLVGGQASSVFTASSTPGSATADVTADGETQTANITIRNGTPTVTAPADITVSADASCQATIPDVTATSTATPGECGGSLTITQSPAAGTTVTVGSHTITVTATDENGNSGSDTTTFTVNDTTAPTVTAPADATYQCASNVPAASPAQATASDSCASVTVTVSESNNGGAGTSASPLVITRTYTATDGAGNSASDSQTITVADTTAPSVTAPAPSTASANASCQAAIPNVVAGSSASDNCGGTVTVTQSPAAGTLVGLGPHTITVTATDAAGNSNTATTTFTVNDTTAPTVTAPADAAYECASDVPAASPSQATAADNCSTPTITVTQTTNGGSGSAASPLVITRTYTATDGAGNTASDSQTITVIDGTAPSVTAPPASSASADAACQAAIPNVVAGSSASDNCGGTVTVTQSPAAGTLVGLGPHTITVTATDAAGNSSTATTTFTVNDATAPTVTAPADATYQCASNVPAASPSQATAADNCSTPTVTVSESNNGGAGTPASPLVITRTYTATDGAGNSASDSQTITVADTTAPSVTAPAPSSASADAASCQAAIPNVIPGSSGSDNCGGSVTLTQSPAAGTLVGLGPHTITVTATDAAGNSNTATTTFTVNDTTAPTIALNGPASMTIECHLGFSDPGATASDACAGSGPATAAGNVNPNVPGSYTITYTATDAAGNAATPVTRTVTVVDTTAPVISVSSAPSSLWQPDHSYHTINVSDIVTGVTDSCSTTLGTSSVVIDKVTSDEPENGDGDGNTLNDIVISSNCKSVQLRAERNGSGNGRVYTITLRTADSSGNIGYATYKVSVPRTQGGTAVDNGPTYTVAGNCP